MSQLPEGMEHCTILFEECPKGHGHLRATNWIKHPCDVCEIEFQSALVAALLPYQERAVRAEAKVAALIKGTE